MPRAEIVIRMVGEKINIMRSSIEDTHYWDRRVGVYKLQLILLFATEHRHGPAAEPRVMTLKG